MSKIKSKKYNSEYYSELKNKDKKSKIYFSNV